MLHKRHFSLEEANDLLKELKPYIIEMVDLKAKLDEKGYDVYKHQYFGGEGPNGTGTFPEEMEQLINCIKVIASNGIMIKSLDRGLLDFPHIRPNGEEVYLCWVYGEDDIQYWHPVQKGFQGRKDIEEL
jgi:hypothetical protein